MRFTPRTSRYRLAAQSAPRPARARRGLRGGQGRTAVFTKSGDAGLNRVWYEQPYVAKRTGFGKPLSKARQAASMVRHRQAATLVEDLRSKVRRDR